MPHTVLDDYDYFDYTIKNNRGGTGDSFENEMFPDEGGEEEKAESKPLIFDIL